MQPQQNIHISPQQIWFFKPIDEIIQSLGKQQNQYFCQLFQKKKKIIELMQAGKIDAKTYFKFVKKAYHNETLKKYAEIDLLDYKDLYFQELDSWFEAKVNETGLSYEQQQQRYNKLQLKNQQNIQKNHKTQIQQPQKQNHYKKESQKIQQKHEPTNNIQSIQVNLNVNEISNLKVMDFYLSKYEQTAYKATFMQLYERKSKILKLIENSTLKFDKYIEFSLKNLNQTKNQDIKKHLKLDLDVINDLYQGNPKKWFDQMLEQTKNDFEAQTKIYEKHQKGIIVKKIDIDLELQQNDGEQLQDNSIDPSQCYSFYVLDQFMQRNDQNADVYLPLLIKKKEMLKLVQKGEINAKKYQQMLQKGIKKTQRDYVKVYYEMDLQNIKILYNGDLKQWFQFIMDQTKSASMLQDYKYQQFKQKLKQIPKPIIKKQSQKIEQKTKQVQKKSLVKTASLKQSTIKLSQIPFKVEQMYNLKILDNAIFNYQNNKTAFIKLFGQKQKMIQMMQNGQLDAEKYKKLQEQLILNLFDNQQLKGQVQFDLMSIQDFHDNDVNKWFEEAVQNTGANYESQKQKYDQLMNGKNSNAETNCTSQIQSIDPPQASQILSFTAINKGFQVFAKNSQMIEILNQKKDKFIDWIKTQKLNGAKYKMLSEKILNSTTNLWLKQIMQTQFSQLHQKYNDNIQKWFQSLSKLLKQTLKSQQVKQSSLKNINQSSTKSKINYYLHQMAIYQSLCKYFKNNKLSASKNEAVKLYLTSARKQIDQTIQSIKNDANFDVYSYCKKFLPPISENIFDQKSLDYQNEVKQYIGLFKNEITSLNEYAKKIKKSTNTKNLQKNKSKIDECNENIKYLISLENTKKLIPLPLIQEEKVALPHLDEFTNLQPEQLQLKITKIQNLDESCLMKVYYLGNKVKQEKIQNNSYKKTMKIKLSDKDMQNVMKGQSNYVSVNLSRKGWFSATQLGTQYFAFQFIRSNVYEGAINVGGININYQGRVRMAKRPTTTEVTEYKLVKYPPYQHSEQVQKQFISKYIPTKKK